MKLFSTLILAALCAVLLVGCGSTAQSEAPPAPQKTLQSVATYNAPPHPSSNSSVSEEAYDSRQKSGYSNPPTLVDTFIVDVWLIMDKDLKIAAGSAKSRASAEEIKRALDFYTQQEWKEIRGYRPWTHWNFVKSLTPQERESIAKEIERYVEANGVKEKEG